MTQDQGAWFVRGCPGVRHAFQEIFNKPDLIVSMDALIIWRPWWIDGSWRPVTEGLHLDQNPFQKPGLETVQGMVALFPVTPSTGGLEVVPRSHTPAALAELKREFPFWDGKGDFCLLGRTDGRSVLLHAAPGDLILWDSRTTHGGKVGSGDLQSPELARLAVTVAMVPRARASQEVLRTRVAGFQEGKTFNHSPHEAGTSTGTLASRSTKRHDLAELSEAQRALL